MEHLKLFENYKSDEEIHEICKKYKIENYTINEDGSIDVDGDVNLIKKGLTELPLTFNRVNGGFNCFHNKLTTLKGSPRIVNGGFRCFDNSLTNLIGGPEEVKEEYACYINGGLTSLEGIAKSIGNGLYSQLCGIIDFKGVPADIHLVGIINLNKTPVYNNLEKFLKKYDDIDIRDIRNKYLDLILEINELDAIQDGRIIGMRMDEVLYNIGLI